jgi:hypothetical protein
MQSNTIEEHKTLVADVGKYTYGVDVYSKFPKLYLFPLALLDLANDEQTEENSRP